MLCLNYTKFKEMVMPSSSIVEVTPEQQERISAFERWMHKYFDAYEEAQNNSPGCLRKFSEIVRKQKPEGPLAAELEGFFNNPFGGEFEKYVADFHFNPTAVQSIPNVRHKRSVDWNHKSSAISRLCNIALANIGKDYAFEQALARLEFQLSNPDSEVELSVPKWKQAELEQELVGLSSEQIQQKVSRREYLGDDCDDCGQTFLYPDPIDTTRLAISLAQNAEQAEKVLALLFNPEKMLDSSFALRNSNGDLSHYPVMLSPAQYLGVDAAVYGLFDGLKAHSLDSEENVIRLLDLGSFGKANLCHSLITDENFEYKKFRHLALDWLYAKTLLPAEEALPSLAVVAEQVQQEAHLSGGRFLVAAGRLMEAHKGSDTISEENLSRIYRLLCRISELDPNETRADVIATLQTICPTVLGKLLAYTRRYSDIVLTSLGLDDATPLFKWIKKCERDQVNALFDVHEARQVMAQVGDSGQDLLKVLAASGSYERSLRRLEAVQGIVDKNLPALLQRYSQEHIRLYSLLPIDDAEDLAARYRYFKMAGKEASKKFGRERSANVRDAAKAALQNLVVNAGFRDLAEMELAVEVRTGEQLKMALAIDEYEFSIAIEQHMPVMNIHKSGRSLKSIPRSLKKNEALGALLTTFDQLKEQSIRYRESMERLMVQGGELSPSQLQDVLQLPVAKSILGSLVFCTASGLVGTLSEDFKSLQTLDDQLVALTKPIQIAHTIQLLDDGTLVDWQRAVERRKICQPFEQVFRDYYLITPAEQSEVHHSQRYLGRRVRTRVFGAILTSLGWRFDGSHGECVATKPVAPKIVGTLALPDVESYLTEDEFTHLGSISFEKNSMEISLAKVPRLAFSEFIRDLNSAVSAGSDEK